MSLTSLELRPLALQPSDVLRPLGAFEELFCLFDQCPGRDRREPQQMTRSMTDIVPASSKSLITGTTVAHGSPGCATPMHLHRNEAEHFCDYRGSYRIAIGEKIFDVSAGASPDISQRV